jgi:mono/diheme cytochrome c family protein
MKALLSPFVNPLRWLAALSLVGTVLVGCGGSDPSSPGASDTAQPAAVQINDTSSGLSIKTALSATPRAASTSSAAASSAAGGETETESSNETSSVTQAAQFTLTASANGTNLLQGTLALRAETEGSGATELEGRFVPAAAASTAPAAAPTADALALFKTTKDALKATLQAAVEQARSVYTAAVAADPAAKAAARTAFKTAVALALDTFRTGLAKAAADAGVSLAGRGDSASHDGSKVKGTFDATNKTLTLTVRQRGQADIMLTGTGTLESGFTGTVATTLNGAAATGEWTATSSPSTVPPVPLPPVTPPPVTPAGDCAAKTVTWSVSGANCSASFAGGASGSSAKLTNLLTGTTGSVTASCNNGAVALASPVCAAVVVTPPTPPTPPAPPAATGDVAAGLALYNGNCSGCHGTSKANASAAKTATGLAAVLKSVGAHAGVAASLGTQDVLNIAAYIASSK